MIKNEGADEFINFAATDEEMNQWMCVPYIEPSKRLEKILLNHGFTDSKNDSHINGLIGYNYLKFLKMVKQPNSDFELYDGDE